MEGLTAAGDAAVVGLARRHVRTPGRRARHDYLCPRGTRREGGGYMGYVPTRLVYISRDWPASDRYVVTPIERGVWSGWVMQD